MPDVFANITAAPLQALEAIASVLELRASMPQQREMLRTYLRDIDFPERAKVLEVGCGTGAITRVLAAWPNVGEVVGVDPSPYLLDKTRSLSPSLPNLGFEVGDGRALGFQGASFDVVILHTVLTHVPGPEAVLTEVHRVLRPGG
jgi:ubiquinone/menaquinone biosynthesis C-methylase UbiE